MSSAGDDLARFVLEYQHKHPVLPSPCVRKRKQPKRPRNGNQSSPLSSMPPAPRGVTTFKTRKTVSSDGTTAITLGNTGYTATGSAGISGIPTYGFAFNAKGFRIFNPASGIVSAVDFAYPSFADYANVFDQVRIISVEITGYYAYTVSTAAANPIMPLFYSCVDYDLDHSPITKSDVLNYDNAKVVQCNAMGKPFVHEIFTPRPLGAVSGSGNTILPAGTWTTANADALVDHFGCFINVDNMGGITSGPVNFIVTLNLEWCASH